MDTPLGQVLADVLQTSPLTANSVYSGDSTDSGNSLTQAEQIVQLESHCMP